jgi:beta-lactamase regulating signal transducer with metallopeptidase domain
MLLAWMAYSVLFGALAFAAAAAVERVAETWGRSLRFVWIAAMLVVAAAPIGFAVRSPAVEPVVVSPVSTAPSTNASDIVVSFGAKRRSSPEPFISRVRRIAASSNDVVLGMWGLASLGWIALVLRAAVGIRRRRERWQTAQVDGVSVLVASDVGPAVVGALSPRIVIPHWAALLDTPARALMLRHESEHIRARDPLCLLAATLVTALLPWNAALWMIARRLRLAIEIDCDSRVLRSSSERREYGELLLTVGARLSAPMPFATSLAERRPLLERRLKAMTALSPRHPRFVTASCVALVIVATTAATRIPRPLSLVHRVAASISTAAVVDDARLAVTNPTLPPATVTPTRASNATPFVPADGPKAASLPVGRFAVGNPDSLTMAEIRTLIEAHHPTVLSGDPGINTITLVVDARGNYVVSTAESRNLAPALMEVPVGGGRRGRSGGAAPAMVGGGDTVFARGRVGGGRMGAMATVDSATAQARLAEMRAALEKITQARDTNAPRSEEVTTARVKLARALGDTVFLRSEGRVYIADGIVQRGGSQPMSDDNIKVAGARVGLNMEVLSRLIDPQSIESIQIRTFADGQMGPSILRVYVVHQRP